MIIRANGHVEHAGFIPNRKIALKQLQDMVGGYIEIIPFRVPDCESRVLNLVMREEGKVALYDTPEWIMTPSNILATRFAQAARLIWPSDYIVGDVVVVATDEDYDNVPLSKEERDHIWSFLDCCCDPAFEPEYAVG